MCEQRLSSHAGDDITIENPLAERDRETLNRGVSSEHSPKELPPLRIHHLLAWMTVTAIMISTSLTFDRQARNGPPIRDPVVIAGLILGAVALAASLTCFGFAIRWKREGCNFPDDPGDGLLLLMARSSLFVVGAIVAVFAIFAIVGDDDWILSFYVIVGLAALIIWLRSNASTLARHADTKAWRVASWMLIAAPGWMPAASLLSGVPLFFSVAVIIACLLWAAYGDVRQRRKRTWTHWLGVFATVAFGFAIICVFHG
jgi:hypothetical protein